MALQAVGLGHLLQVWAFWGFKHQFCVSSVAGVYPIYHICSRAVTVWGFVWFSHELVFHMLVQDLGLFSSHSSSVFPG